MIGWNLLFPLVLATAFYMGFGNLVKEGDGRLQVIDIAVVNHTESEENYFRQVVETLAKKGDNQLFDIKTQDEQEAENLLSETKIDGIFYIEENIRLKVNENGMNQTILSSFLKSYNNKAYLLKDILSGHSEMNPEQVLQAVSKEQSFVSLKESGKKEVSPYMSFFYSLIAMACLYGGWIGSEVLKDIRADQSEIGKRYECAPIRKSTSLLAGIFAGGILLSVCIGILMIYIEYVLKLPMYVPFWSKVVIVVLGTMLGIALGLFSGALAAKKPVLREVLPLAISMICSFFSGLMIGNIRQQIEEIAPILNKINPAACITDSLYTLGTYGTGERFYINILCIIGVTLVLLIISILKLRGEAYDNI